MRWTFVAVLAFAALEATAEDQLAISNYTHYTLLATELSPAEARGRANRKIAAKLDALLRTRLGKTLEMLNYSPISPDASSDIKIQPYIDEMRMVSGAARFWIGPFGGSSYMDVRLRIIEGKTGVILEDVPFTTRGNAWLGTVTIGGTDRGMMNRIVDQIAVHIEGLMPQ